MYWEAYNMITGAWLCTVYGVNETEAKERARIKTNVNFNSIRVVVRRPQGPPGLDPAEEVNEEWNE